MSLRTGSGTADSSEPVRIGEPVGEPDDVLEVRRRPLVAAALGAGASLVAVAYLARAAGGGGALDWALAVVLGAVGVANLAALLDARTPLLVADELGVRLRLGRTWVGLPWGGLHEIDVRPRRAWWRDGLLTVRTHYVQRVLEDLDPGARQVARLNRRLYRAPLVVPLGLGTRVVGADPDLSGALRAFAAGRTPVVEASPVEEGTLEPDDVPLSGPEAVSAPAAETPVPASTPEPSARRLPGLRPAVAHLIGVVAARWDRDPDDPDEPEDELDDELDDEVDDEVDDEPDTEAEGEPGGEPYAGPDADPDDTRGAGDEPDPAAPVGGPLPQDPDEPVRPIPLVPLRPLPRHRVAPVRASATPAPGRETLAAARAEVRHESRARIEASAALEEDTQVWSELHAESPEPDAEEQPLLIDDYVARPAAEPVVGPVFAAARERLGLTVDQLAERTRIRPHVIEAVEVDDFSACGGDFYARGHLRTLARVLGVDVAPLLEAYDERYADAPIDPRRVFEAELAAAGSIRATRGGPNWSVLVAAVMALVLCWSVARLVTGGAGRAAEEVVLSGSGVSSHARTLAAKPVPVTLTAAGGGARVLVRNGLGRLVYSGDLAYGQAHTLRAAPPVRVQSSDGSVRVAVAGKDRGRMGPAGRPATRSYVAGG